MSVFVLANCGDKPRSSTVDSMSEMVRLPMPNEQGEYFLQPFQLIGLSSLSQIGGQFVEFFVKPMVKNNKLSGQKPQTRFIKAGSVFVAGDEASLELATIYAHMQNMAAFDKLVGAADVNQWPRSIGVGVRLAGTNTNNAFYDGDIDAMLFIPNSGPNLALAVNAGVLAHEHFHSLFHKLVVTPLNQEGKNPTMASFTTHDKTAFYQRAGIFGEGESKEIAADIDNQRSSYHLLMMRGMNEGLADFWGWLYTGDPDFIKTSLPGELGERTLKVQYESERLQLSVRSDLQETVRLFTRNPKSYSNNVVAYAYTLGTQYSRIFKIYTESYAMSHNLDLQKAKVIIAQSLIKTLPSLKDKIATLAVDDYLDPSDLLYLFHANLADANQADCEVLSEIMNKRELTMTTYVCQQNADSGKWIVNSKQPTVDSKSAVSQKIVAPPEPSVKFK